MKTLISKTHVKTKALRKTNPGLQAVILAARKQPAWLPLAHRLSGPTRLFATLNLDHIDVHTKAGDTVLIAGKVLGTGTLTKKVRVVALSFSASARTKLKATKSEAVTLLEEIQANPKAEGVKVL